MEYHHWLIIASLTFVIVERVKPARPEQGMLRPQLANDLAYLAINGSLFAIATESVRRWFGDSTRDVLAAGSILPERGWLADQHFWVQFALFFIASDFLQWCIHNLLHRVPFLWNFHKVHHSIYQMDWAGNMRFHWMENVVYKALQFVPLLFLGGDHEPLLVVYVFGTFWGHFNHSNLDFGIGPLAYIFNSPRMHMWHHDASNEGGTAKNFGIVLSLWDWLFGTVFWPRDRAPERIGYANDAEMPRILPSQMLFPALRKK